MLVNLRSQLGAPPTMAVHGSLDSDLSVLWTLGKALEFSGIEQLPGPKKVLGRIEVEGRTGFILYVGDISQKLRGGISQLYKSYF